MDHMTNARNEEVLSLEAASEEEARAQAAAHWNILGDEVLLTVVGEEKKIFGLFGRKLKIEARRRAAEEPQAPSACEAPSDPEPEARDFISLLKRVLKAANLDLEVSEQPDGSVSLSGPDSRILLAGRRGEGLKALDYIVNLMARNDGPVPHVRIDCDGFRRKREKDLERIAMDAAMEAMKTRRTVFLQPMSSWERRIVHLTLRESCNVETHSIGVEPNRKVAVRLLGASSGRGERRDGERAPRASRSGERPARSERPRGERQESGSRRSGSGRPRRRPSSGKRPPRPAAPAAAEEQ